MKHTKNSLIALAGLMLLVGVVASLMPLVSRGQGQGPGLPPPFDKVVTQTVNALQPRQYYLTKETVTGGNALTACAAGYHMASLWEIFDTSNLRYNTNLGFAQEDSGSGPPSGKQGWVRTGFAGDTSLNPGLANCNTWTTSQAGGPAGTTVMLNTTWNSTVGRAVDPWFPTQRLCNADISVWCVAD